MARKAGQILPFRVPFFRIFYSSTYTTIYIITLCILAITPVSLLWQSVEASADQYLTMIGGTYLLTALIAIFIYASRLFTNRTVLAGVGKAYIPVERGEVSKSVRKMIVKQLDRSAMVAWESRPRDLLGEILQAERTGVLPAETSSVGRNDYTVGREIPIDPANPPWGYVQHAGWSSPEPKEDDAMPNIQFAPVIAELPNLIEARAVSLAPSDPLSLSSDDPQLADPVVADVLRRPETMGMRDYLAQLSYLRLLSSKEVGQSFLHQYEKARFGAVPVNEAEFKRLMAAFADLLSGMTELDPDIIHEIRVQSIDKATAWDGEDGEVTYPRQTYSPPLSTPTSSVISPVTARTAPSRNVTPYLHHDADSTESPASIIHNTSGDYFEPQAENDSGSVLRHTPSDDDG